MGQSKASSHKLVLLGHKAGTFSVAIQSTIQYG